MPNVIKATALVQPRDPQYAGQNQDLLTSRVLKQGSFAQPRSAVSTDFRVIAPQEQYLEELNHLKIEIEAARSELRAMQAELNTPPAIPERIIPERPKDLTDLDLNALEKHVSELYAEEQAAAERLRAAEETLQRVNAELAKDADEVKAHAKNEGYLEGFNKGYEEALAEFKGRNEPAAEKLAYLIERLGEFEQARLRESEQELIELAVAVAEKLVSTEIKSKPHTIAQMLQETITQNHKAEYIRITIAEELLPVEASTSVEIISLLEGLGANVTVISDNRATAGAIQVETPSGIIDMGIDTQLSNVREILQGEVV